MNNTVVLCIAVLVMFYGALSLNVSVMRVKRGSDPKVTEAALTKAIRAHGNAAEYIPLFSLGLLYLNAAAPSHFIDGLAIVVVLSRILHAAGMFLIQDVNQPHPLRAVGALGTYLCLFGLGSALAAIAFP